MVNKSSRFNFVLVVVLFIGYPCFAGEYQLYEATWESLKSYKEPDGNYERFAMVISENG